MTSAGSLRKLKQLLGSFEVSMAAALSLIHLGQPSEFCKRVALVRKFLVGGHCVLFVTRGRSYRRAEKSALLLSSNRTIEYDDVYEVDSNTEGSG